MIYYGPILPRIMLQKHREPPLSKTRREGVPTSTRELTSSLSVSPVSHSALSSYQAAADFLQRNKLLSIIRAHEAQAEGYAYLVICLVPNN